MRAYVSDEMLAETSRTTTPLDDAGSSDPASAGCRNELTRNATKAAIATPGERKPEPPDESCSPLERGTRRRVGSRSTTRYARPPAACSTRSASVVASGGPGSAATTRRRRQSAPAPARRRPATPGSPHAGGRRHLALRTRAGASRHAGAGRRRRRGADRPATGVAGPRARPRRRRGGRRRGAPAVRRDPGRDAVRRVGQGRRAPERRVRRLDRRCGYARLHRHPDEGRWQPRRPPRRGARAGR